MNRRVGVLPAVAVCLLVIGMVEDSLSAVPAEDAADWDEQIYAARCPAWATDSLPAEMLPHLGKFGLPEPYPQRSGPLGKGVAGIDRWQANRFLVYRAKTAKFLYGDYTPLRIDYRPGSLRHVLHRSAPKRQEEKADDSA